MTPYGADIGLDERESESHRDLHGKGGETTGGDQLKRRGGNDRDDTTTGAPVGTPASNRAGRRSIRFVVRAQAGCHSLDLRHHTESVLTEDLADVLIAVAAADERLGDLRQHRYVFHPF